MCIRNLGSFYHLLHCCIFHTKSDVVEECVIKQDCFLIHVTDQTAQIGNTNITYTGSVDCDISFLHIVIARQQIHQRRFTRPRLSYQCDRLTFRNCQVHMLQHFPFTVITESDILKLNFVIQSLQRFRIRNFFDLILSFQNLVYTLH